MYLNFFTISKVPFQSVLDWLRLGYTETKTELKGQGFIVNKAKNLYFNPTGNDKGSIITFVANQKNISLRTAAEYLYNQFMATENVLIPEYDLHYCEFLAKEGISEETAKDWEIGLVKNHKGPAAGRIAFKVKDVNGEKVGYALYNPKDKSWFYFKGYQHNHLYGLDRVKGDSVVLLSNPLEAVRFNSNGIALTHPGLTKPQENLLTKFSFIEVMCPEYENIVLKLVKGSFVKLLAC